MTKLIDLAGKTFTYLTVVSRAENQKSTTMWHCICKCGTHRVVSSIQLTRKKRQTRSCGCWNRERITSHGQYGHPLYFTWAGMIQRCTNPKNRKYPIYGGRGISVCDKWLNSPSAFFEDMGERPVGLSLDRINNNGNYTPDNCRWATIFEQNNNRTFHRKL